MRHTAAATATTTTATTAHWMSHSLRCTRLAKRRAGIIDARIEVQPLVLLVAVPAENVVKRVATFTILFVSRVEPHHLAPRSDVFVLGQPHRHIVVDIPADRDTFSYVVLRDRNEALVHKLYSIWFTPGVLLAVFVVARVATVAIVTLTFQPRVKRRRRENDRATTSLLRADETSVIEFSKDEHL